MKICEIRAAELKGATPLGGWSSELEQQDCVRTLVVVNTDERVNGVGSVFTNACLVQAAQFGSLRCRCNSGSLPQSIGREQNSWPGCR